VSPSSSSGLFHFFDGRREKTNESQYLQQNGVPAHTARIIAKINQHKPELSALGILPNQIRTLLKGSVDCNEFMEDLSKTLFWYGYKIWKKRVQLVARFFQMLLRNGSFGKTVKSPPATDPSTSTAEWAIYQCRNKRFATAHKSTIIVRLKQTLLRTSVISSHNRVKAIELSQLTSGQRVLSPEISSLAKTSSEGTMIEINDNPRDVVSVLIFLSLFLSLSASL